MVTGCCACGWGVASDSTLKDKSTTNALRGWFAMLAMDIYIR